MNRVKRLKGARRTIGECALIGTASALALSSSAVADGPTGQSASSRIKALALESEDVARIPTDPSRVEGTVDPRSLPESVQAQAPLVEAGDRISELIAQQGDAGFAGIGLSRDGSAVLLYWQGELPPAVAALVNELRTTANIEVIGRPYSHDQLMSEAQRLAETYNTQSGIATIVGVGPNEDVSGLDVVLNRELDVAQARDTIESQIPLTFSTGSPPEPAARFGDISPFWGGAHHYSPDNDLSCSTAFAAMRTGTKQEWMITANHCTRTSPPSNHYNGIASPGFTPRFIGSKAPGFSSTLDVAKLTGGDYSPFVYWGPWDTNLGIPVAFKGNPLLNTIQYADGAFSGSQCGVVRRVNYIIPQLGYGPTFELDSTGRFNDECTVPNAGFGDSGGPAVGITDTGRAIARGVIIAGDFSDPWGTTACPGPVLRECTHISYHAQIQQTEQVLEVTLQLD